MTSKVSTDEVYRKKIKGEIKFAISLNEEQKIGKQIALSNTITIFNGKAGSGKSLLAAQIALDLLFRREVEKIVISRAMVTSGNEEVGFLPGGINEKLSGFTAPVYDNMNRLVDKQKIEALVTEGKIEVIPMAFMRGRNFSEAIVIIDEAQNCTDEQMELLLTRLCIGSKMIICGDSHQVDLSDKKKSCFKFLCKGFTEVDGMTVVTLNQNHRHPIVDSILSIYSEVRN